MTPPLNEARLPLDQPKQHGPSIRLVGHDYSRAGTYFVRVCTRNRACIFVDVAGGEMQSNQCGQVVSKLWRELPNHYASVPSQFPVSSASTRIGMPPSLDLTLRNRIEFMREFCVTVGSRGRSE